MVPKVLLLAVLLTAAAITESRPHKKKHLYNSYENNEQQQPTSDMDLNQFYSNSNTGNSRYNTQYDNSGLGSASQEHYPYQQQEQLQRMVVPQSSEESTYQQQGNGENYTYQQQGQQQRKVVPQSSEESTYQQQGNGENYPYQQQGQQQREVVQQSSEESIYQQQGIGHKYRKKTNLGENSSGSSESQEQQQHFGIHPRSNQKHVQKHFQEVGTSESQEQFRGKQQTQRYEQQYQNGQNQEINGQHSSQEYYGEQRNQKHNQHHKKHYSQHDQQHQVDSDESFEIRQAHKTVVHHSSEELGGRMVVNQQGNRGGYSHEMDSNESLPGSHLNDIRVATSGTGAGSPFY